MKKPKTNQKEVTENIMLLLMMMTAKGEFNKERVEKLMASNFPLWRLKILVVSG